MSKIKDRTEEFREAVRSYALKQQYDQAKLSKISESLIMRRPHRKSPFIQMALRTLESIQTLHNFVVDHKKDYMDQHRTTEKDRDNIEHEVGIFVKACREPIEILLNSIQNTNNREQTKDWDNPKELVNEDIIAHKHGVVLILSEHLHAVTASFDKLRAARFQDKIERKMPKRIKYPDQKSNSLENSFANDVQETDYRRHTLGELKGMQQQQMDEETQALQVELTNLLDSVEETEAKMIEMSALNRLFSTHVLHQAQQIESIYEQSVQATENVQKGNLELSKAISRNSSSRTYILLFLVVLTSALLFLDWYQ